MDQVDNVYGHLQAEQIYYDDQDEGYEEPSSSEDALAISPDPEDMRENEAIPRKIPSDISPVRPSVIMTPVSMVPDSTTSPQSSRGHNMRRRRMRLYESRNSSEYSRLNIVMQYLRELRERDGSDTVDGALIFPAARDGRTDVVEALLAIGACPNTTSTSNWTPLHEAARFGRDDTIQLLLSEGADPDRRTNTGRTPLHLAAERGYYEAAFLLLEAGARVDVTTALGITAMDYARNNGHIDVLELLQDYL